MLGNHLIRSTDTDLIPDAISRHIIQSLSSAGFLVTDASHHLSIRAEFGGTGDWECAVVYLAGNTLWIKVLAKRWWLLFMAGDHTHQYEALWSAVDQMLGALSFDGAIEQGTVGELNKPSQI